MNILKGSRILLRQYHSHTSTFHKHSNNMSNNNTNLLLSQLLQESQKQNKILEDINENLKTQNGSLSYILIYLMENQEK
jgi:hypothetical protein